MINEENRKRSGGVTWVVIVLAFVGLVAFKLMLPSEEEQRLPKCVSTIAGGPPIVTPCRK